MYKIKDAFNTVIRGKISDIWFNRSRKITAKYPYYPDSRPTKIAGRLWSWGNRINEVGSDMFDPTVSGRRPEKPKKEFPYTPPTPRTLPIGLINTNTGEIWRATHTDHWYECGKLSMRIIDYTGYKVVRPGEHLPPEPPRKEFVQESKPQLDRPALNKETRSIDRSAFDDMQYEGLD